MAVAVLNPRDCLQNPLTYRRALLSSRNPNPSRPNRAQPGRRKRNPNSSSPPRAAVPAPPHVAAKDLVMEKVKILKRGEEIPKNFTANPDPVPDLGSTHRLGPDPQLVPTQIRLKEHNKAAARGFYAGSAFVTSPPPSSLPIPAFFMKRSGDVDDDAKKSEGIDDFATIGLRRVLRLNF